eukprot:m.337399 g.337399  ORF g.337399 m.337399 type:complete len:210 (-) comp18119_c0_seq1:55-684(-)
MANMLQFLVVVTALVFLARPSTACGSWQKSSPAKPLGTDAFPVKYGSHPVLYETYMCSCGNYTGSLWNDNVGFGAGWKCWYHIFGPGYGTNTFCKVGDYSVMTSKFPSYNGPEYKNSTSSSPVPSKSIPSPATLKYKNYACVQFLSNPIEGVGPSVIPGGLYIDPDTGGYVCNSVFASRVTVSTSVFSQGTPGNYAVVTGSACTTEDTA